MSEAIGVLRREHANMASLLKTLEWQVAQFERGGRPDYDVISSTVDYFLSFPDLYHHPKEDKVFARLQERAPAAAERVGDLRREHEALAIRTRELAAGVRAILGEAQVPRDSFVNWAKAFLELQWQHMNKEEELFFPLALEHLTPSDWAALEQEMTDQEDPLFGERVGERYEVLRNMILRWQAQQEVH